VDHGLEPSWNTASPRATRMADSDVTAELIKLPPSEPFDACTPRRLMARDRPRSHPPARFGPACLGGRASCGAVNAPLRR